MLFPPLILHLRTWVYIVHFDTGYCSLLALIASQIGTWSCFGLLHIAWG